MKKITLCLLCCLVSFFQVPAQTNEKYARVDKFAESLGPLTSLNVATIADTLTRMLQTKEEKARAIYYWITHHIGLDPKAMRSNDNSKSDPVKVIEWRKATPAGFALLFQEMASQADIRCLAIDGYIRNNTEQINEQPDEMNHAWNVVQLGQSPTEWYYVDAARGSGLLDKKAANFIPSFTSEYFFADRRLFNLDHFPDNEAWQLGAGPGKLSEFYSLPVIFPAAYRLGMTAMIPFRGFIKTKVQQTVQFNIKLREPTAVELIELNLGDELKKAKAIPMNFTNKQGDVSFSYIFREEGEWPLTIKMDGKEILSYTLQVIE